jgi:hypothetical protein
MIPVLCAQGILSPVAALPETSRQIEDVMHVVFARLVLGAFWLVPVHWRQPADRSTNLAGSNP